MVARLNHRAQRHHPAIDFCPHGLITNIGVDGIGKINRRRALGKLDQLSLRREGKNAILIHRHPSMFEQLFRAAGMIDNLNQITEPAYLCIGCFALLLI